jgi:hypothetical protein
MHREMIGRLVLAAFSLSFSGACAPTGNADQDMSANLDLWQDKTADCPDDFGSELTNAFGRLDGKVVAIIKPGDEQCAGVNSDHVVLDVTSGADAYRMVVNVQSTFAGVDPRVLYLEKQTALVGPAWSDGWHTGIDFDYVRTLSLNKADFMPYDMPTLVSLLNNRIALGMPVSVFATSSGGNSAHLVHRNALNQDGAIVIDAASQNPTYLFFAFADSQF